MGMIKGQSQYEAMKRGEKLTRREAILAKCYDCNGGNESNHDCGVKFCPLYQYSPYKGVK